MRALVFMSLSSEKNHSQESHHHYQRRRSSLKASSTTQSTKIQEKNIGDKDRRLEWPPIKARNTINSDYCRQTLWKEISRQNIWKNFKALVRLKIKERNMWEQYSKQIIVHNLIY